MVRHFIQPAQIAQHDFDRDVLAHCDHVEIHQRADRVLGIRHRRAQLLALLDRQRAKHVLHDLARQIGREIGDFVGVELLGRRDQLVGLHVRDQRFAHRVGHFEQDFTVALGFDEIPDDQPLFERQCFEDVGDVGRMQLVELFPQLGDVLLLDEALDELVARHFLAVDQALDELMLAQQLDDLFQAVLHALAILIRVQP